MEYRGKKFVVMEIFLTFIAFIILLISELTLIWVKNLVSILFLYISTYILTIFLPSLLIEVISKFLKIGELKDSCGGIPHAGRLIGYAERSLIYLSFLIILNQYSKDFSSALGFLTFIIAGKAIFRFSGRDIVDRRCADWYILGTFLSVLTGLFITWVSFRFIMIDIIG